MSNTSTSKSKILSTKSKDYGIYKDKKQQQKKIAGKGKIYLENQDINTKVEMEIEECGKQKLEVDMIDELSEKISHKRTDSVMEAMATGKSVSFKDVKEEIEKEENNKVVSLELNDLISKTNRKMMMLEIMEEKKNMEDNTNMKLEWDDMKKKNKMLCDYLEMKKSMTMVEAFMSAVVKEEVINMRNTGIDSKATTKKLDCMSEELFKKHEKMEILSSNPKKCSCTDCRIKSMMYSSKTRNHRLTSMKKCMMTDGLEIEVTADDTRFSLFSSAKKDNSKHMTLFEKKDNKVIMDMKFTETEELLWETDDYDFSIGMTVNLYNLWMEKNITVSYSSFMIVSWIRLMDLDMSKTSLMTEDDKKSNSEFMEDVVPNGNCFMKFLKAFMKEMMPELKESQFFYSIAELPEWVEMKLLTLLEKHNVYVRYTSQEDMNNHISVRRFKGAIKMKGYLLITPMFRHIKWFADETSPTYKNWLNTEFDRKEKMVMSMLNELWRAQDGEEYRMGNSENIMWIMCMNFQDYTEMINAIYNVEMKELLSFYDSQNFRLKTMKRQMKEEFEAILDENKFYQLSSGFVCSFQDLSSEIFNNHKKYNVLGWRSKMFRELLEDPMRFESFFWNTSIILEHFQELKELYARWGFMSVSGAYMNWIDKSFSVIHEISYKILELIDPNEYEDINLWKRKQPVGLANKIKINILSETLNMEMEQPSVDDYIEEDNYIEDWEATHNIDT